MATAHNCIRCGKKRLGRFTRPRTATFGGWSHGGHVPNYYCYNCLPEGEGRDEDPMAKKTASTATPVKIDPTAARQEGLQLITPLSGEIEALTITSEEDYERADALRGRILKAEKVWGDKMEAIIRPIRQGLDGLYDLNREVAKPLADLKARVTDGMKEWKRKELMAIQEANRAKQEEESRLRQEAEEKARAAETAKTPQMRGKLQAQAERAEQQAEVVAQAPAPQPIRAVYSSVRPIKVPRVKNLQEFLKGIIDGYVPEEAVMITSKVLTDAYKDDPEGFLAWPGVEVVDDVQIVGR